jgi:N-acetylglucosaminyldiphosphoundecaprenol N-acetyl-beta-D-mannosaminyltransferase
MEKKEVRFKGVKISNVDYRDAYTIIKKNINKTGYVCLNEVANIMAATRDKTLYDAINTSLLSLSDGAPLSWYARLLGCKKIERITGFELLRKMIESDNGLTHYLLGDTEQTIGRVIEKAQKANRNLKITGHSPPFRNEFSDEDNKIIFEKVNGTHSDIIWVSFGGKKQEKWMYKNLYRLNRGVMAGVGAAFKFYVGDLYIPPKIAQKLGMQWFFRMLQHPLRWTRYMLVDKIIFAIHFPFEVLKHYIQVLKNDNKIKRID